MDCGSCAELIPDDSIFCPECGARQEISRAGSFANTGSVGLGGQEVTGGRSFGVVSGEAVRQQREMGQGQAGGLPPEVLQQIAMGVQQQQNLPQGQYPPQQGMPPNQMGQYPPQQGMPPNQMGQYPPQQGMPPDQMGQYPPQQGMPPDQMGQYPPQGQPPVTNVGGSQSDLPQQSRGPSLSSGALPQKNPANVTPFAPGGTLVGSNPSSSPTDAMVNRLADAERAMKDERRSQWLNINQTPASNVLASLGAELPSHLRVEEGNPAKEIMAGALGQTTSNAPDEALLRRMCEVAVRRVARKRGVAVETPQAKTEDGELRVNITYVDDGRVLDTPEDLKQAFEHAIQTELALKGMDLLPVLTLFRSKDGEVQNLDKGSKDAEAEDDEEMFACEICDGLVKESDNECPHCGAMFEDEEEVVEKAPQRSGPPGRSSGPPGPKKSGGPPGPKKSGGPPGPKKSGGPPGPSKSGGPPKKSGGPPGPSKSGSPPKKSGGPPGPSKSGGPPKKSGGPPGPSKSGGPPKRSNPPKGGPGGGPPGPKRSPR